MTWGCVQRRSGLRHRGVVVCFGCLGVGGIVFAHLSFDFCRMESVSVIHRGGREVCEQTPIRTCYNSCLAIGIEVGEAQLCRFHVVECWGGGKGVTGGCRV